ncbi:MAG: hypothetical protein JW915_09550 [Chitinispirillaceae bacterium]|nr:hypothetical protein [Chitinispirillaceae bacterium]
MMVRFFDKPGVSIVSLFLFIMTQTFSIEAQGLLREYWSGISGMSVRDLTSNENYPNSPTSRNIITVFEGPVNTEDNYGTRIRGYVIPPTTGSYTFWISSNDSSELWLSTSSDPAGKRLIASVSGFTNSREWTKYSSQQSSPISLTAGQSYYVEVLHKEGINSDNIAVGWQGPGITGDTERPIPASRLTPYEAGLLREVWTGISGTAVSDLTSSPNYPSSPNLSQIIYSFEGPVDNAENYGTRIRGYVVPPTTGSYTFWIASDDNSELWLSTSADPAGKSLIASVSGWTGSREWTKYSSQQSSARTLTAGQKYYIEVLQKEGTGGDNVAVGWQGPGITGDAERPIPMSRLLPWTGEAQTYTLTVSNDGNGTTTPSGNVTVNAGSATSIAATAATNYVFRSWSVTSGTASIADSLSENTTVTLNSGNASVRANFALRTYTLTMSNDGNGTTNPAGAVTVNHGTATTITATPSSGYVFRSWSVASGIATITDTLAASTTVTLNSGNATLRANFTLHTYTLTMSNDGHGSTNPTGTVTVNHGTATAISATPSSGYVFRSWSVASGTATITDTLVANTTVTLNGDATLRANFRLRTYTLTMSDDGHGSTNPTGTVTVNHGAATSITATPATGYYFMNWTVTSGTATFDNSAASVTTVTLASGDATIRANFTQEMDTLTVSSDANGTTAPSGIIAIGRGVAFPVTATANTGYHFVNWSILSGSPLIANTSSAATTVTLSNGNGSIRANFAENLPTLPNNRQISITGSLYDVNGTPIGSPEPVNMEMRVSLFSQAAEGNALYTEDFLNQNDQSIQVNNGTFVVRLGTGVTSDTLVTVITTNNNLWAEITVLDEEPDVLQPRTPLTAAPYILNRDQQ